MTFDDFVIIDQFTTNATLRHNALQGLIHCKADLKKIVLKTLRYKVATMQIKFKHSKKIILEGKMTKVVRISENLLNDARKYSKVNHRSITGQIEHWARIGKCAEENPYLTYNFIKDILNGMKELDQGEKTEYSFG